MIRTGTIVRKKAVSGTSTGHQRKDRASRLHSKRADKAPSQTKSGQSDPSRQNHVTVVCLELHIFPNFQLFSFLFT